MDDTTPNPSQWDQDGAEYVRSNEEWVARFARDLASRLRGVTLDQAFALGQELSLDDHLRALSPERAAADMASSP
ncbi:MAG: hypothetical protein ABI330_01910 [Caldimonas sp.]